LKVEKASRGLAIDEVNDTFGAMSMIETALQGEDQTF
jgi:hypothetical protein